MSEFEDRQARRAKREAERKAREEEEMKASLESERKRRAGENSKPAQSDAELDDILLEAEAIAELELEQEAEKHLAQMMAELDMEEEKPKPVASKAKLGIQIECDACGEKNFSSDRFCGKCGVPVRLTANKPAAQPTLPKTNAGINRGSSANPNAVTGPIVKRTDPTPQIEKGAIFAEQESIVEKKNERKAWLEQMMKGGDQEKRDDEKAKKQLEINKQQAKEDQVKRQQNELKRLEKELADLDEDKWAEELMKDLYQCSCGTHNIEGDKFCGKCGKKL